MYGGVETLLATLAREAPIAPAMCPSFGLCFEGRFSRELSRLGHTPHVFGHVRLSRPTSVIRARRALATVLGRTPFDVVVCHQPWSYVVFGSAIRRRGLPVVMWMHMATEGRHFVDRLARLHAPDLVICNSRFTAFRTSRWMTRSPIVHVYCPVSTPTNAASQRQKSLLRESLDTAENDKVIIQVSRLEAWKGQHVLLEALTTFRDRPEWTCWIVGGAQRPSEVEYLRQLQALARSAGISRRVRFLGERTDVSELLNAADVFCQPNTAPEPFGLSLIEALQAGLPVITSDIGGACEIVDASCGVLTPPGDATAVADALRRVIDDPVLKAKLGSAARNRPEALCRPDRQMQRILEVLNSVAAA
jgi:glycosyltransferase involved in cell wall biosynthesis